MGNALVNNNPTYFGPDKRPIVEFSIEDAREIHKIKIKKDKLEKQKLLSRQMQNDPFPHIGATSKGTNWSKPSGTVTEEKAVPTKKNKQKKKMNKKPKEESQNEPEEKQTDSASKKRKNDSSNSNKQKEPKKPKSNTADYQKMVDQYKQQFSKPEKNNWLVDE